MIQIYVTAFMPNWNATNKNVDHFDHDLYLIIEVYSKFQLKFTVEKIQTLYLSASGFDGPLGAQKVVQLYR